MSTPRGRSIHVLDRLELDMLATGNLQTWLRLLKLPEDSLLTASTGEANLYIHVHATALTSNHSLKLNAEPSLEAHTASFQSRLRFPTGLCGHVTRLPPVEARYAEQSLENSNNWIGCSSVIILP